MGRIWRKFRLKPHLRDGSSCRPTPCSSRRSTTWSGLYFNPPERAVVLSVDEKSQIQALDRSQPVLPMMPGMPERRTHDYFRNGLATLFAAFDVADGHVISALHRRHRPEFKKFLVTIDKEVPADLDVHLICDNTAPTKPRRSGPGWPNTPDSTCTSPPPVVLDQPGGAVVRLPRRPDDPPRLHKSVHALEADIRAWVKNWNEDPHRSSGPRPPTRSSTPSPASADESPAQDTHSGQRHGPNPPGGVRAVLDPPRRRHRDSPRGPDPGPQGASAAYRHRVELLQP